MKLPEIKVNLVALIKFVIKIFKWKKKHFGYRMGKKAAKHDPKGRTLKMAKYMAAIPDPPESFDNIAIVQSKLSLSVKELYPMLGNNRFGNCVVAGAAHYITLANGRIGEKVIPSEKEVVRVYRKLSGCKDRGLVMLDFLKYWRKNKISDHEILAFGRVDFKNHKLVKQCIQLFGGVDLGFLVQNEAFADFETGKTWTPGPSDGGGHCVIACSYDAETVTLLTWGGVIRGTWAWWDLQLDECFVIMPLESVQAGFAPGFDYSGLCADFQSVTS